MEKSCRREKMENIFKRKRREKMEDISKKKEDIIRSPLI